MKRNISIFMLLFVMIGTYFKGQRKSPVSIAIWEHEKHQSSAVPNPVLKNWEAVRMLRDFVFSSVCLVSVFLFRRGNCAKIYLMMVLVKIRLVL